jgi:simple sugar transport system ATP-binding protein
MAAALGAIEQLEAEVEEEAQHADATTAPAVSAAPVVLSIRDAHAVARDGRPLLDGFSIDVRRGEIVGIAGVEGNGQKAIGDLVSSLLTLGSGIVEVAGKPVGSGAGAMARAGVAVIPEDRHVSGCVLDMTVTENLLLDRYRDVCSRGLVNRRRAHQIARGLVREFDIMTSSLDAPLRSLSGGNQQRVVLARELSRQPIVLVAAQPTRGLDVGAIAYMTERIRAAAQSGVGVLLISTELEEILELADRVAVIHRGRIVGEMTRREIDLERLGLMMGGQAA